jgi:putative ABC transport system permease protein
MWKGLRVALRALTRQPAFALIVVLTLTLGIGGSVAIFSVVNAVLLRELPYPDDDRIFLVRSVTADGSPTGPITPPELRPFYDAGEHPIVEAAALTWSQEVQIVGDDGRPHTTARFDVTDQFFDVFKPAMALRRTFERNEMPGPIVLAYAIWRDQFGADPEIVGRSVQAEGVPRMVVGVTGPEFEFPENPGYWDLIRLGPNFDGNRMYRGFVRIRREVPVAVFQAELTTLGATLGPDPATNQPPVLVAQPTLHYVVGDLSTTVLILFGAAGILLLIAAINATNLLLSRSTARAREMALREAIGAPRWQVIRQLFTESLTVSILGGALGVAAAAACVRLLIGMAPPDLPRLDTVPIDLRVMAFALGVALLTELLVGLAPAWRLTRNPLRGLMIEGGRGASDGPARNRLFGILVGTEIALATLLVIGAGLLVRSYVNLSATDPGFSPDRVLTFFMNVPGRTEIQRELDEQGQVRFTGSLQPLVAFFRELRERIEGLPGVASVAYTSSLPIARAQTDRLITFHLPDQAGSATDAARTARIRGVSSGFFDTMGIRRLAGRDLLPTDRPDAPGAAVVNAAFVRLYLQGSEPLGRRIEFTENLWAPGAIGFPFAHRTVDDVEIVGVVDDVRYLALGEPAEPSIYMSSEQWTTRRTTVVVKTTIERPESLVPAIRREIDAIDPLLGADSHCTRRSCAPRWRARGSGRR